MAEIAFASPEIALCHARIERTIGRILALMEDAGQQASLAPPVPEANSLVAIAAHVLANAAENILGTVGGEPIVRDRGEEFDHLPAPAELLAEWPRLRERLRAVAATIPSSALFEPRAHPRRGDPPVLDIFLVVLRHCGEHEGQAALTRDWLRTLPAG